MSGAVTYCNKCGEIYPNKTLYKCPECGSENMLREAGDYDGPTTFDEFEGFDDDPKPAA